MTLLFYSFFVMPEVCNRASILPETWIPASAGMTVYFTSYPSCPMSVIGHPFHLKHGFPASAGMTVHFALYLSCPMSVIGHPLYLKPGFPASGNDALFYFLSVTPEASVGIHFSLHPQAVIQIRPFGVMFLNKLELPYPIPFFHLPFPR
jgi:hypothetical protein